MDALGICLRENFGWRVLRRTPLAERNDRLKVTDAAGSLPSSGKEARP
jgi:hypothetical protein